MSYNRTQWFLQFIFFPQWIRLECKALVSEYEVKLVNSLSPIWPAKQIVYVKN